MTLSAFAPATQAWFASTLGTPTKAQEQAWKAIATGAHSLVVAPTGSGKTLAAFLGALDRLLASPASDEASTRCRVLYVSPLKALAADIDRNLRGPLAGIGAHARRRGEHVRPLHIATRTGDTTPTARRAFANRGADIMITTPESLFLLLTSAARENLRGIDTVIVDEIHAVAASKRGAHLAVSLERLDALLPKPAQRIGLSATVRPLSEITELLGGGNPVTVVSPRSTKQLNLTVSVPLADMTDLGGRDDERSIWPSVEGEIYQHIRAHRSTIVFVNSRLRAERLCARLNERAATDWEPSPVAHLPAQMMAQSPSALGAPPTIARAHHGSVSGQARRDIEEALKAGRLPAVVATSSLELGIDMGAVDLVIQVEAPPSVASGMQRVGRAGHQVGAPSTGIMFPKHRTDVLHCAVLAERMNNGQLEALHYPRNPLDVLAQHIIAMVSMDPWNRDALASLVRRAAPFTHLGERALDSVLDMLTGRYPSDDFAQLRPRVVWNREQNLLTARPGAHGVAVTSGGTIADRGYYGVYLSEGNQQSGKRIGELEEEMVYESRIGDVFLLGSSTWRIAEITPDRVLVTPAPGQAARMPFWKGDGPGRPVELGRAIGEFTREIANANSSERLVKAGLDENAQVNLQEHLAQQKASTGVLPDDRAIVVERFRDQVGDWRVIVHSVFGAPVNGAWSMAIRARLREQFGFDAQVMHTDDAIVLRLPDMDAIPGAGFVRFESQEIRDLVTAELAGSPMFAARFRECAARALLLPKQRPGKRMPLWQQRHRSAQLLQVAEKFPDFPIVAEAARECLQDVFDITALASIMDDLHTGDISIFEVETPSPSPFSRSALMAYLGAFLYGDDLPLAERRAAALEVNPELLAELLGTDDANELIGPHIAEELAGYLQWLTPSRHATDLESTIDLLRDVGALTTPQARERGVATQWLLDLRAAGRIWRYDAAGAQHWAVVEDAGRIHAALGVALPAEIPASLRVPGDNPAEALVARFARTHTTFSAADCASRLHLPEETVRAQLSELAANGTLVEVGENRWCHTQVWRLLRRRSLQALRKEIEPVSQNTFVAFAQHWRQTEEHEAIYTLEGAPLLASALETQLLPARTENYHPSVLDELTGTGELLWTGQGALGDNDGWIVIASAETAPLLFPEPSEEPTGEVHQNILRALTEHGAMFFRELSSTISTEYGPGATVTALWDLVWSGHLTCDTVAPLRALIGPGRRASQPGRPQRLGRRPRLVTAPAQVAGRWALTPIRDLDPTRRAHARAQTLLARHGIITRGTLTSERMSGGFNALYPVLSGMEQAGQIRRGYFVDGLGGLQFASSEAVEELRRHHDDSDLSLSVLSAVDPASPFGAALAWPSTQGEHRPGRRPGALVLCRGQEPIAFLERGGRTLLTFNNADATTIVEALRQAVLQGSLNELALETIDGQSVHESALRGALLDAQFRTTPKAIRFP
ncbi:MAG: DEAD/DEAH box helicase [Corynebacteriales bacterium]|nr:DEAD/DEAH box helicase [Mycobacteriales bacterium]